MAFYLSNCPPNPCNPCGPYGYNPCLPQPYCPQPCPPCLADGAFNNICANGNGVFAGTVTASGFSGPIASSSANLSGTTTINTGRLVINPRTTSVTVPINTTVGSLVNVAYINTTAVNPGDFISLGTNSTTFGTPGQIIFIRNSGSVPLDVTAGSDWMPANGTSYTPTTTQVLQNSLTMFVNIGV